MFLDDRRIKESAGREQSLLPLLDFSRKIEGDSARRVQGGGLEPGTSGLQHQHRPKPLGHSATLPLKRDAR